MSARQRSMRAAEKRMNRRQKASASSGGAAPELDSFGFYAAAPLVDRFFTLDMEAAEAAQERETRLASMRPIHIAAHRGDPRALVDALRRGADVNEAVGGAVFNGEDHGDDDLHAAAGSSHAQSSKAHPAASSSVSGAVPGSAAAPGGLASSSSAAAAGAGAMKSGVVIAASSSSGSKGDVLSGARGDNGVGWNSGHFAAAGGHLAVLRELCGRGLQVNAQDPNGWSPLHVAAASGHAGCVRELIQHGAVVHLRSATGNTALHLAARNGHAACIRELIMGGVRSEVESRNASGKTAREVARRYCLISAGEGPYETRRRDTMLVPTVDVIDAAKADKDRAIATMSGRYRPGGSSAAAPSLSSLGLGGSGNNNHNNNHLPHHLHPSSSFGANNHPRRRPRERLATANGAAATVEEQIREWNAFRFDKTTLVMAKLREYVAGQTIAVRAIADAFQRREAAEFPGDFPLVFVFVGGSGCGKKQLAIATAEFAFPHDGNLHVIDMTRFLRKEAAVDFEDELARQLGLPKHRKATDPPHRVDAVILLKDIDRANSEVFRPLRTTFREGRITDGAGATVITCTRSVFIMTVTDDAYTSVIRSVCNRHPIAPGASDLQRETRDHVLKDEFQRDVRPPLRQLFRFPEIPAEVTEVLPFLPYDRPELVAIASTQLRRQQRLFRADGVRVTTDPGVLDHVISKFVGKRGIRAIEDAIEGDIGGPVRDAIKGGRISKGDTVIVESTSGQGLRLKVRFKIKVPKNLCDTHEYYLN